MKIYYKLYNFNYSKKLPVEPLLCCQFSVYDKPKTAWKSIFDNLYSYGHEQQLNKYP